MPFDACFIALADIFIFVLCFKFDGKFVLLEVFFKVVQ